MLDVLSIDCSSRWLFTPHTHLGSHHHALARGDVLDVLGGLDDGKIIIALNWPYLWNVVFATQPALSLTTTRRLSSSYSFANYHSGEFTQTHT